MYIYKFYNLHFSSVYSYMVWKVLIWGQILVCDIFMNSYILNSKRIQNSHHIGWFMRVCVCECLWEFFFNVSQKQIIAACPNLGRYTYIIQIVPKAREQEHTKWNSTIYFLVILNNKYLNVFICMQFLMYIFSIFF